METLEVFPTESNKPNETRGLTGKKVKKAKKHGKKEKIESAGFLDVLSEAELKNLEEKIEESVDEVLSTGNVFARSPTRKNFEAYKQAIKKFLKLIEKRLYKMKEGVDVRSGRTRLNMVAEIVDEKLMEIAKRLFENEKSTLGFAAKVEEIKGLLLDLYR